MARRYENNDDKPRRKRLASNPSPWALEQRRMWERLTPKEAKAIGSGSFGDPEDDEDEDFTIDTAKQLLLILRAIDYGRERLDGLQVKLSDLFERYPPVEDMWRQFRKAGGLTADDFVKFLKGQLRPRITRQRKHLRLVSSRKVLPLKLTKRPGNDVA